MAASQSQCQPAWSSLPRNSNETPRMMSADEEQHEGQVEAREHGRVPLGEGGEHAGAGDDQPDLVAVPDGADRVDRDAPFEVVAADEVVQHADAEVEALEEQKSRTRGRRGR